jgi:hypothetical protein
MFFELHEKRGKKKVDLPNLRWCVPIHKKKSDTRAENLQPQNTKNPPNTGSISHTCSLQELRQNPEPESQTKYRKHKMGGEQTDARDEME